ncbi:MAG: hypothetical protein ACOX41_05650 [Anaerovoracaceae bacterium]|jgi:hypothetical protein
MKSSIKKRTWQAVYRLLNRVSPLAGDCGQLCQAACCRPVSPDMGIYLMPGEHKLFTGQEDWLTWDWDYARDYEFPASWSGRVYFIRCNTPPHCVRAMRPLQCRTYPLAPHLDARNRLSLVLYSAPTPYVCPLIAERRPLQPDFVRATFTVWRHLIRGDHRIRDLVRMDSRERLLQGEDIVTVYAPGLAV